MKENIKMALINMFGEEKLDKNFVKNAKNQALIKEYEEAMQKCNDAYNQYEQQMRNDVIESLTKEELHKIKDLYMQELIEIYEKENHTKLNSYVR